MKDLFNISFSNKTLNSLILNIFPFQKLFNFKEFKRKLILMSCASLFLIISIIFGVSALYHFLIPFWGEALASFFLCFLFLSIAIGLMLITILLQSKQKQSSPQIIPLLEKSLDHLKSLDCDDLKKALKKVPPKTLVTVFGAVALASCILYLKKKK